MERPLKTALTQEGSQNGSKAQGAQESSPAASSQKGSSQLLTHTVFHSRRETWYPKPSSSSRKGLEKYSATPGISRRQELLYFPLTLQIPKCAEDKTVLPIARGFPSGSSPVSCLPQGPHSMEDNLSCPEFSRSTFYHTALNPGHRRAFPQVWEKRLPSPN